MNLKIPLGEGHGFTLLIKKEEEEGVIIATRVGLTDRPGYQVQRILAFSLDDS